MSESTEETDDEKKTILIAAKCLIFSAWTPTGEWNAARTCSIIWQRYGKAASERTSEKRSQNESEQIVIFHLYWWNMVRCICAINHSVSAMIHLQQQTVHLLRLFWIQWCCIASKTQTTKIYALAFSTLILPNFFRLVFFSSFTFRYTLYCVYKVYTIYIVQLKQAGEKKNSIYQKSHDLPIFHVIQWTFFHYLYLYVVAINSSTITNFTDWLKLKKNYLLPFREIELFFPLCFYFILRYFFFKCVWFIHCFLCVSVNFFWLALHQQARSGLNIFEQTNSREINNEYSGRKNPHNIHILNVFADT